MSHWNNVEHDGLPPCDGTRIFIGINTAGYACCFNDIEESSVVACHYVTAEESNCLMSSLLWWRELDWPNSPAPDCGEAGHDEGCCGNASCLPGAHQWEPAQNASPAFAVCVKCGDTTPATSCRCNAVPCRCGGSTVPVGVDSSRAPEQKSSPPTELNSSEVGGPVIQEGAGTRNRQHDAGVPPTSEDVKR
jgi:hypothetical protein